MLKNGPGAGPAVLGPPGRPREPPKQAKIGPKKGPKMTPKMGSFLTPKMGPKIGVSIGTQNRVDPDHESPPPQS